MKKLLISLCIFVAVAVQADEGTLVWKSAQPTGILTGPWGQTVENCHATIRVKTVNGEEQQRYNPVECTMPGVLNMTWPLDEEVLNKKGLRPEAHYMRVEPNGDVFLH